MLIKKALLKTNAFFQFKWNNKGFFSQFINSHVIYLTNEQGENWFLPLKIPTCQSQQRQQQTPGKTQCIIVMQSVMVSFYIPKSNQKLPKQTGKTIAI